MKLRVPPTEKNFPGYKKPPEVRGTTLLEQTEYIFITLRETARIARRTLLNNLTGNGKRN